jgi:type I restriction enzyme, S subunit
MSEVAATTTMERLGDHVDLLAGFPFKSASYTTHPTAIRLARGDNIIQGRLRWDSAMRWPTNQVDGLERYRLQLGDVIIAMDRPWIEAGLKYARIGEGDLPALLVQRVSRLRGKVGLDQAFLYCLVGSREFTDHVLAVQTGTAVPHISSQQILDFRFRLPSLGEQRAVAGVLSALDDKIEQNRRTAQELERLAQAIFRAWFVDFEPVKAKAVGATAFPSMPWPVFDALPTRFVDSAIGPVPEGWAPQTVSAAFDVNPVRSLKKNVSAPYLDMKSMPTEGHAPESWITRPVGSGMRFMNGDTLVARITPCLENGKTAFVDFLDDGQIAWGSTEYIVLRPKTPLPPVFAYCLARTDEFRDFAIQNMTGTSGRQRVTPTDMEHFQIAVPTEAAAVGFGEVVQPLFGCICAGMDESRKLAEMRDYLLPKVLSGDVRVEAVHG